MSDCSTTIHGQNILTRDVIVALPQACYLCTWLSLSDISKRDVCARVYFPFLWSPDCTIYAYYDTDAHAKQNIDSSSNSTTFCFRAWTYTLGSPPESKKKRRGGQELEFFEGRNFKVMCACWQQLTSSIIFVLLLLLLWKFATITI